jgi:shikimate kinase
MEMTEPKRIFVIGHMGAGKSLFAEGLADELDWQYIDANPSLERYIGRSLRDILGEQGEAAFHRCEGEILTHYKAQEHVVVVLEEAVIATEENRKLLSDEYVIYLKVSVPTQLDRMRGNRVPLLPIADMEAFLNQQHRERDHLFEQAAAHTIDSVLVENSVEKTIAADVSAAKKELEAS